VGAHNLDYVGAKPNPTPRQNTFTEREKDRPQKPWYINKSNEPAKTYTPQPPPGSFTKLSKASNTSAQLSGEMKGLRPGMRVSHEKFNAGKVIKVEGQGDNLMATIFFDQHGEKKIMLKFARLHILES
jgi:DNA helicase-2/ATP-dependent DNA helicase PcrA